MNIIPSTWMNIGIEDITMYQMAKVIIPKCEFPVRKFERKYTDALIVSGNKNENTL